MATLREVALNYPDEYVSVSTKLPKADAVLLKLICNRNNPPIPPSEYIRNLIRDNINSPKKAFLAGKNKITYNKTTNSFDWRVELDSGQEVEVLSSLSVDFLNSLKHEINKALIERNEWVHQTKPDSVGIPKELIGDKK